MRRKVLVALAAALFLAVPAMASTFVHMSQQELVAQADALVIGRVVELNSFWSDSGRMMVTEAQIAVAETLIGEAPATVTVRTFGGQVGDIQVEAHGFPRFERRERVMLFLKHEPSDGSLRVLGYQQGQFRVVERLDGVTLAVPQVDEGARFLTPGGQLAPEPKSVEIGQFKNRIRQIADGISRAVR